MEFPSNDMNRQSKNEIQRPSSVTPLACRLCDKVFLGAQALVKHFESSHMVDNKIVPEKQCDLNLNNPHTGDLNQFPNLFRPCFSLQQPSLLHEMKQFTHTSMNQNPNSNVTQVVVSAASQVPSRSIYTLFPYPSSSSHAITVAQPIPPPLHYIPSTGGSGSGGGNGGGYMLRPSLTLAPPQVPLVMRNHVFGQPTLSTLEANRALEARCSSDCTKLYINKLDRPIKEAVKSNNNGDDKFKLDLTLRL